MKRLIAVLGCVALLVLLAGLYGFIRTGGYEEVIRTGTTSTDFIGLMFSRRHYRFTIASGLVGLALAVMDIRSLTTRTQTRFRGEPQPMDHPLGFLAVRARRYFLVFALLAYIAIYIRTMGHTLSDGFPVTQGGGLLFLATFGLARRPLNKTIYQVFQKSTEQAEDVLDAFLEGRVPVRQREQKGRRR